MCPVCAAKISERRRVELGQALEGWKAQGGYTYLLTLTVPHYQGCRAFGLLDTTLDLVKRFWSGRGRASSQIPGYVGQVRALEVTHGENGWHPHVHVLLFTTSELGRGVMQSLYDRWAGLVVRSGLGTPNQHALTLQDGSEAAKYVGKWGLSEELTKAHIKQARKAGRTPFALLADYLEGDERAGELFREFALAFKGRRQLVWSRGLRELLGLVKEQSDEEIAATIEAKDYLVVSLGVEEWKFICKHELKGEVLEVARMGEAKEVRRLLELYAGPSP
jgi:hypothetical protein